VAYLCAGWMCVRLRDLYARVEVRAEELEQMVRQRTAALERANDDLALFSYTAAHDLRTPLRAINSFSAMILEKNVDHLDQFSVSYLSRIKSAGERMSSVIEGLLALIREAKHDVAMEPIDLSAMAERIVTGLVAAHPNRSVEVLVHPGLRAVGDADSIQIVLENLIDNAWKFTGNTVTAKIEIGAERIDGRSRFYVRDNGAGFDMNYSHKLFAPFQRLHHAFEFEGAGIGLARVQRIIQRHRGEISLHSDIGRGTTAYFSLGGAA